MYASNTYAYDKSVQYGAQNVYLVWDVFPGTTVVVDGFTASTSLSPLLVPGLAPGLNTLKITVTAADGTSTATYTLRVTRMTLAQMASYFTLEYGTTLTNQPQFASTGTVYASNERVPFTVLFDEVKWVAESSTNLPPYLVMSVSFKPTVVYQQGALVGNAAEALENINTYENPNTYNAIFTAVATTTGVFLVEVQIVDPSMSGDSIFVGPPRSYSVRYGAMSMATSTWDALPAPSGSTYGKQMVGTFKFDIIGYDALGNRVAGPSRSLSIVDGARDFTTKVGA